MEKRNIKEKRLFWRRLLQRFRNMISKLFCSLDNLLRTHLIGNQYVGINENISSKFGV